MSKNFSNHPVFSDCHSHSDLASPHALSNPIFAFEGRGKMKKFIEDIRKERRVDAATEWLLNLIENGKFSPTLCTNFDKVEFPAYQRALLLYGEKYGEPPFYVVQNAYDAFGKQLKEHFALHTVDTENRDSLEKFSMLQVICSRELLSYDFETAMSIWRHNYLFNKIFNNPLEIAIVHTTSEDCIKKCLAVICKIGVDKCYIIPEAVDKKENLEGYYTICSVDGSAETAERFFKEYYGA